MYLRFTSLFLPCQPLFGSHSATQPALHLADHQFWWISLDGTFVLGSEKCWGGQADWWLLLVACSLLVGCGLLLVVDVDVVVVGCCFCGCWLLLVYPENTHGDLFWNPKITLDIWYIPCAHSKLVSKLCYVPKFKNIKIKPAGCSLKVLISLAAGRSQDRSSCKLTWQWNIQHFHGIV